MKWMELLIGGPQMFLRRRGGNLTGVREHFFKRQRVLIEQLALGRGEARQLDQLVVGRLSSRQAVRPVNEERPALLFEPKDARKHAFGEERLLVQERVARRRSGADLHLQSLNQKVERQI